MFSFVAQINKYLLFFVTISFLSFSSTAQWYNPDKVNKKANALNEKAYLAAMDGNYVEALKWLDDAIKKDKNFVDAYLSQAGIYANLHNYSTSVEKYEKAFALDAIYTHQYLLPYSISLAGIGKFEKALSAVKEFLKDPTLNEYSLQAGNYRKNTYAFAIERKASTNVQFNHLPNSINTPASEYYPSITIDGNTIVFTRRENRDEDFYISTRTDSGWNKAKMLSGKVNTQFNEGAQNISQDGEWLVFTGCNYPEGAGSCDIYLSYKTPKGNWSEPELLPFNTEHWESAPCLSPDKRDLYFSSSAPGGLGGKDIWVSRKGDDGRWSKPLNLGSKINTSGDESCPFIHADNTTLYFTSSGLSGYGNSDLFVTKKASDGWLTPLNLGFPINTIDEEGSMVVSADGRTAYFASDRADSYGGLDIYSFQLPEEVSATPTRWVRGQVIDKKTHDGLPSRVVLTDLNTRNVAFRLQTDEDGHFLITLPVGKEFAFNVARKNYLFFSENLTPKETNTDTTTQVYISLQPIEPGASLVLRNIFFDIGMAELQPASQYELNLLIALMNENPNMEIRIEGHTDNTGTPASNLTLSKERAQAVANYLIEKGIDKKRLQTVGFGQTMPVESNNTEEGKSRNRRTEIYILSN